MFDLEVLEVEGFLENYAEDGWLPGGIPLEWTQYWSWRNQCASRNGDLVQRRGESLAGVWRAFVKMYAWAGSSAY